MLTIETLELASGITLNNPVLVANNLMTANSTWVSEVIGKQNDIQKTDGGNETVNFRLTVFANLEAFNAGKPPVTDLHDGNTVKNYSFTASQYPDTAPREAAYAYALTNEPLLAGATLVPDVEV